MKIHYLALSLLFSCTAFGQSKALQLSFLHDFDLPQNTLLNETTVGGLSGLAYDEKANQIIGVCDETRVYRFDLELTSNAFKVTPKKLIELKNSKDETYKHRSLDLEGLALLKNGSLLISTEGQLAKDPAPKIEPQIFTFSGEGVFESELQVPKKFRIGDGKESAWGVVDNASFESLTVTPDYKKLFTGVEHPLREDGNPATFEKGSLNRLIEFALDEKDTYVAKKQYAYPLDKIPVPTGVDLKAFDIKAQENGLAEMLAVDDHRLLALERSFVKAVSKDDPSKIIAGNSIRIYEIDVDQADDVAAVKSLGQLPENTRALKKRLVLDLDTIKEKLTKPELDNIEGMTFGPTVEGKKTLILVSDDNLSKRQRTVFIAFLLE